MKIVCIGGGPAGLYFALLMKQLDPRHDITVVERNKPYDTFGWGVVFSDATHGQHAPVGPADRGRDPAGLQPLGRHRAPVQGPHDRAAAATASSASGARSCSTSCRRAARQLGVKLVFETEVDCRRRLPRRRPGHRQRRHQLQHPQQVRRRLQARHRDPAQPLHLAGHAPACTTPSPSLFEKTEHGWFQAHIYKFDDDTTTFIVETPETRVAGARPGPAPTRTSRSPSARSSSPTTCRATS